MKTLALMGFLMLTLSSLMIILSIGAPIPKITDDDSQYRDVTNAGAYKVDLVVKKGFYRFRLDSWTKRKLLTEYITSTDINISSLRNFPFRTRKFNHVVHQLGINTCLTLKLELSLSFSTV